MVFRAMWSLNQGGLYPWFGGSKVAVHLVLDKFHHFSVTLYSAGPIRLKVAAIIG